MQTCYFAGLKNLPADMVPVAIARGVPPWYKGRRELRLAPTYAMFDLSAADFDRDFTAILDALDPAEIVKDLGDNAVLLCWEKPGERCHRRLVAEYLEKKLGIEITEVGFDRAAVPGYHTLPSGLKKEKKSRRRPRPQPPIQGLLF